MRSVMDCLLLITHESNELIKLALEFLAQEEVNLLRGETTKRSLLMLKSRLHKHVLPWFLKYSISTINYRNIVEFVEYLKGQNLASGTVLQYVNALRRLMKFALMKGIIEVLPSFPSIKNNSNSRGGFTLEEYKRLVRAAKRMTLTDWYGEFSSTPDINWRCKAGGIFTGNQFVISEMALLIRFMVNTFVRPVDIKLIKHEHIQIVRGQNTYLRLTLPESKRHKTQIISMPIAVDIYERLKNISNQRGYAQASDYVFLPEIKNREDAIYLISRDFRKILVETGLRYGRHGQGRSLYSLRNTAITNRLLYGQGIDLLTLARNARTSVEMIERFYASELSAEMNVGMLHSRRTQRKSESHGFR